MIHLQPTKNAETIADYLHENGKQWQTKETASIPHSFAGLKFTKGVSNTQTVKKINDVFKQVYGVKPEDLNIKSRKRHFSDLRHAYRFWLSTYTSLSQSLIGDLSNNAHHTTIISSIRKYQYICRQTPYLRDNHDKFKQLMA